MGPPTASVGMGATGGAHAPKPPVPLPNLVLHGSQRYVDGLAGTPQQRANEIGGTRWPTEQGTTAMVTSNAQAYRGSYPDVAGSVRGFQHDVTDVPTVKWWAFDTRDRENLATTSAADCRIPWFRNVRLPEVHSITVQNVKVPATVPGETYYLRIFPHGLHRLKEGNVRTVPVVGPQAVEEYTVYVGGEKSSVLGGVTYYFIRDPFSLPVNNPERPGDFIEVSLYDHAGVVPLTVGSTAVDQNISFEVVLTKRSRAHQPFM